MIRGRYGYQPSLPASAGGEGVGVVVKLGKHSERKLYDTFTIAVSPASFAACAKYAVACRMPGLMG